MKNSKEEPMTNPLISEQKSLYQSQM